MGKSYKEPKDGYSKKKHHLAPVMKQKFNPLREIAHVADFDDLDEYDELISAEETRNKIVDRGRK